MKTAERDPEKVKCPHCNAIVSLDTNAKKNRCPSCNTLVKLRIQKPDQIKKRQILETSTKPAKKTEDRIMRCGKCSTRSRVKSDVGNYRCPKCKYILEYVRESSHAPNKSTNFSNTRKSDPIKTKYSHQNFPNQVRSSDTKFDTQVQSTLAKKVSVKTREIKADIVKSVKFSIVGFKHRGVDITFIQNITGNSIRFQPEPTNRHDPNAVKCISEDRHFGYIEKEKAAAVQRLIKSSSNFTIKVNDFDEYKMLVNVDFKVCQKKKRTDPPCTPIGSLASVPGIYGIIFRLNGTEFMYVGQSVDVKKRIIQHQSQLESLSHQNDYLQEGWDQNSQSFEYKILERVPDGLNGMQRQIFLFQREVYWIENCHKVSANKISGDLVLTKESKLELSTIKKSLKLKFKNHRRFKLHQKEMLGELIIRLGIIHIWKDEIKPTNVLTWLNKTRYGYLDRTPDIDRSHILYEKLHRALKLVQREIENISIEKKIIETFPEGTKTKNSKYETIEQKSLSKFLNTLEKYDTIETFQETDFEQKKVLRSAITYDICLTEILDKNTLATLNKGLPVEKVDVNQKSLLPENKDPWWKFF